MAANWKNNLAASVYLIEERPMQSQTEWKVGPSAWADFVRAHPELGYRPGRWQFHNFLRFHREALVAWDAIRLAKRRFWIAHNERFSRVAFACATGVQPKGATALVGGKGT